MIKMFYNDHVNLSTRYDEENINIIKDIMILTIHSNITHIKARNVRLHCCGIMGEGGFIKVLERSHLFQTRFFREFLEAA